MSLASPDVWLELCLDFVGSCGADPQQQLGRDQVMEILSQTACTEGLKVSDEELQLLRILKKETRLPQFMSPQQYFFGSGLVNAAEAIGYATAPLGRSHAVIGDNNIIFTH